MTKLTETQTIVLTAAALRPDNIAMPLPKGLAGAAAKMAVTKMIERGWLQEVDANLRRGEPLWRETGDGHGTRWWSLTRACWPLGSNPLWLIGSRQTTNARATRRPPNNPSSTLAPSRRC